MKENLFLLSLIITCTWVCSCNSGGSGACNIDSAAVAREFATNHPDTIPNREKFSSSKPFMKYKYFSKIIDDRSARNAHLDYLLTGGITNSSSDIIESLWITKSDLDTLVKYSV